MISLRNHFILQVCWAAYIFSKYGWRLRNNIGSLASPLAFENKSSLPSSGGIAINGTLRYLLIKTHWESSPFSGKRVEKRWRAKHHVLEFWCVTKVFFHICCFPVVSFLKWSGIWTMVPNRHLFIYTFSYVLHTFPLPPFFMSSLNLLFYLKNVVFSLVHKSEIFPM